MASSVEDAVRKATELSSGDDDNIVVCGGASIYEQMLPMCDTCIVTRMEQVFEADRFFPDLDSKPEFEKVWESQPQTENGVTYRFVEYRRK